MVAFIKKWGLSILMVLVIIGTFSYGFYKRSKWRRDHALIELKAIRVPRGWGYDILRDGSPVYHQVIIPSVPGNRAFHSKEDALAAGKVVYDRILSGQAPFVTDSEMHKLNIYIPPDSTEYRDSVPVR
jgi:Domain of unknown function (DUF4907)